MRDTATVSRYRRKETMLQNNAWAKNLFPLSNFWGHNPNCVVNFIRLVGWHTCLNIKNL